MTSLPDVPTIVSLPFVPHVGRRSSGAKRRWGWGCRWGCRWGWGCGLRLNDSRVDVVAEEATVGTGVARGRDVRVAVQVDEPVVRRVRRSAEPARVRPVVPEDVGAIGRRAKTDVNRLADQAEVAFIVADRLVAVRVHPAVDRRPGEVRVADVGVRRIGRVEHEGQRSVADLEVPVHHLDGDAVGSAVHADEDAVIGAVDHPVPGRARVRLPSPAIAVKMPVDDVRVAVERVSVVSAVHDAVAIEVRPLPDDRGGEASRIGRGRGWTSQRQLSHQFSGEPAGPSWRTPRWPGLTPHHLPSRAR
jgi:hypothetical protein